MSLAWIVASVGLAIGLFMGLALVVRPRASHLSIGLGSVPDKSGGVGESRAFGGLLVGMHGAALYQALDYLLRPSQAGSILAESAAQLMTLVLAIGWLCALLGRIASVVIDREGLPLNLRLIGVDAVMAFTLLAPFLAILMAA